MEAALVQRVTTRAMLEHLLKIFREMSRITNGDWPRAFVFLSIEAANWEHVARQRGQTHSGASDTDRARPVSRLGLSESLRLPRESVRRVVAELIELGLCEADDAGVVVSSSSFAEARLKRGRQHIYRSLLQTITELEKLGLRARCPTGQVLRQGALREIIAKRDPASVYRTALYYASMICANEKDNYPSFFTAMLFNTIMVLNVRHITFDISKARQYGGAAAPPPDTERLPARLTEVAAMMGISAESCRRHLVVLENAGLCVRSDGGVIIPTSALQRPELLASGRRVHLWTMQLISCLSGSSLEWRDPIDISPQAEAS